MDVLLKTGDKVDIQIHNPNNPEGVKTLFSQVMNVDTEFYYITAPVIKGMVYPVMIGQKADLTYYRDAGVFSFTIAILRKVQENNFELYQVARISEPRKTQRRAYFRLKYMLSGYIKSFENETACDILIQDISGGGIRATATKSFYVSEKIECTLNLDHETIKVAATVVRSFRNSEQQKYELGIKFEDVSEQNQNKIIAFIFQKQGELRKKGLI